MSYRSSVNYLTLDNYPKNTKHADFTIQRDIIHQKLVPAPAPAPAHVPSEILDEMPSDRKVTTLKWSNGTYKTKDPSVWGPAFWFTLHNSAAHYPENASAICKERSKGFILGIPYMVPCFSCSEHARAFIDKYKNSLDVVTSSRKNFFDFFVKFHNYVNVRYGKKEMSYEDAYKMYNGGINVSKLSY